jgi:hypothetical protein
MTAQNEPGRTGHHHAEGDLSCREIFERLGDYIDHELDPDLCDKIESHVENCEPCIAFINTLRRTVELFHGYGETDAKRELPEPVKENLQQFLKKNLEEK